MKETATAATPTRTSFQKQGSSAVQSTQRSIHSFFSKSPAVGTPTRSNGSKVNQDLPSSINSRKALTTPLKKPAFRNPAVKNTTPICSSDAIEPPSSPGTHLGDISEEADEDDFGSTVSTAKAIKQSDCLVLPSSPTRKAKKAVKYAESDSSCEESTPKLMATSVKKRRVSRLKIAEDSDDDTEFIDNRHQVSSGEDDEKEDKFIAEDDSDVPISAVRKRKRPLTTTSPRKRSNKSKLSSCSGETLDEEIDLPEASTAQKWKYDPSSVDTFSHKSSNTSKDLNSKKKPTEKKAHKTEPENRYPWLAQLRDADEIPIGHPNYDPRTLFIPQYAWNKFTAFEHQYWSIKQKLWDTVVFFKKGKFYELYENDATIGHQLFNLKLTDRVNMRMVGVPEASLDHWANQFVAKGFKIARVDQCESALAKEMRESEGGKKTSKPTDKIIKRELACILTGGTLVEGSMLQDDMATYCVSIKEGASDEVPVFGVAIVDTATGQFMISEFDDDASLTKFETFVAQIRPQELILEKGSISSKAIRVLKNNTSPTTIWNYLKPSTEFWTADNTRRELDSGQYFREGNGDPVWPEILHEARHKDLLMSAVGALIQYLRTLKLEHNLLTQRNFVLYDPIQKGTTLVLDGQTLINLEVFVNNFDGTPTGTLFALINRCITPFGKRLLRQWVCHPLADVHKINERLDSVDMINKDRTLSNHFNECLSGLPDLERLISRIHAGSCRPEDFVKVLNAFSQIEYTASLLSSYKEGTGCIAELLSSLPDMRENLEWWKSAFDYSKAKDCKVLVPTAGIEEEFDASQKCVADIEKEMAALLVKKRKELGDSSQISYKNIGKEIYQLEIPASIKVPKDWQMMSSAGKFKRYYFSELKQLIRKLQEAQETHNQITQQVARKFYARFDDDYDMWQKVIKVVARLDCLISLAAASAALGEPSCRPQFVEAERSTVKFEELRHPCLLSHVSDYIPNDIRLGGESANITLLTGANAAGKSTVLRMTCIAVIMAQIGCYVPAISAQLTPVDRIMSRLGANDNIFAAQSTFFVELMETKKILAEATPRSLVILDELGRGTSSYDGVAVAHSVLHHIASHIGCVGFFATHYHSLASEFAAHPEIAPMRMQIHVDEAQRRITFLYKLEAGVAHGSFGMHCAAMCGIPSKVIDRAEEAARKWEHTGRHKAPSEAAHAAHSVLPLGLQSDVSWALKETCEAGVISERGLRVLLKAIEAL